jgi:FlaA1/EpsC-like NDP-sugar epimerase
MTQMNLQWLEELPQLPRAVRMVIVVSAHIALFAAAYLAAFLIRFDFSFPSEWQPIILATFPMALLSKVLVFAAFRNFNGWWKYVSLHDIMELARSLAIASALLLTFNVFIHVLVIFPRSIYILDYGLSLFLIAAARGSLRLLREAMQTPTHTTERTRPLLILGAGDTGETLLREITKNRNLPYKTIGFLDDDPYKRGLRIHGVPVLGQVSSLEEVVLKHRIEEVIIAMPSASREQLRRVIDLSKEIGVKTRILPAVEAILEGHVSLNALREVSIDDLLGREPVRLDTGAIGRFVEGQTVLVTGAGGSIGSEICRQLLRFSPARIIMVERAETPLFFIHRELADHVVDVEPIIADVTDRERMRRVFETYRPAVVIHAAAYKHVPLMEQYPCQAVLNNVQGTRNVADLAAEFDCKNFILVSTDKAVNPTSVMGATKRVTELYVLSLNSRFPTHYCAVRFGNVLGSNGSVVPIFTEQIKNGGPVTVTHPEMTRYFMTIPEASQLVLQAAANGQGGELFILDMGQPVRIADLARDMIRLSGLREDQVEIVFSGIRPGEKLFEELTLDEERVDKTRHEKIFVGQTADAELNLLRDRLEHLITAARNDDNLAVRNELKIIIPTYSWDSPKNVVTLRPAANS